MADNRFKLTGTIVKVWDLIVKPPRFSKREFSIRFTDQDFHNKFIERIIKFALLNDNTAIAEDMNVDDQVEVSFFIDGRDYEKDGRKDNFTSLAAYDVDFLEKAKKKEEDPMDMFNEKIEEDFENIDVFKDPKAAVDALDNVGKVSKPKEPNAIDEFDDLPF